MSDNGIYRYTPQIQLKILAILWRDEQSYSMYREAIKPKYFSNSVHIDVCRILFDYHERYNCAPTYEVLLEEVTQLCSKTARKRNLLDDYVDVVDQMSELELFDIDYIKDKIVSFGKRQALVDAVMASADILQEKPDTEYPTIEKLVKDAMSVGEDVNDLGSDLFENIEERFIGYLSDDDVIERIPTEIERLDECLGGGLGRTEMGVVVAPPGRGKTTMLISIGGAAIENGYNVLHVSLENNEKQILRNYDLRLLKHDFDYVRDNVDKSIAAMMNIQRFRRGRLIVKKYPTKSVGVQTIRMLLDQLRIVQNFVPDVLIIDYGAILKPSVNYSEKRTSIEGIYEDLRAIADDYNLALWTAAQGNRGALSKKIVTMADLAECFAIGNICDVMTCICQTEREKQRGDIRVFLAKVRDAEDGLVLQGKILYSTKRIELYETVEVSDTDDEDEDDGEDSWENNQ